MHDWDVLFFLAGFLITAIAKFSSGQHKDDKENKDDTIQELKSERDYWHNLYLDEAKECDKFRKELDDNDRK